MKYILPEQEIIKKYIDGGSLRTLGFEYNVGYDTIQQILIRNNIKRRKVGNQPYYYVNHDIFDNINCVNARILGLIASDGNISKRSSYRVRFWNKELELCEFVKNHLGGTIKYAKNKNCYSTELVSEKIYKYLNNIGITENKSKTLNIDFSIFNDNKELKYSFLIGLLEGDGNILYLKRSNNSIVTDISLITGSKLFKEQLLLNYAEFQKVDIIGSELQNKNISVNYKLIVNTNINKLLLTKTILEISKICGIHKRKYNFIQQVNNYLESR